MVDLESVRQRYPHYDWEENHRGVRYLSIWTLLLGSILILAGLMLCALVLTGRIPLPYASTTRILLGMAVLILGLVLGSGFLAVSRTLCMAREIERNTRYAMNIWFVLEEKDLSEEGGQSIPSGEYPANEESS